MWPIAAYVSIGRASACASVATVRSSKSRFAIDEYTVRATYTGHVQQRSSPWRRPLTVKDQAASLQEQRGVWN